MKGASSCIVIGFSFRDEYLDVDFLDFLKREKTKLIVISPGASTNLQVNPSIGKSVQDLQKKQKLLLIDKPFEKLTLGDLRGSLTAEEELF
jgi:hypothetical protein